MTLISRSLSQVNVFGDIHIDLPVLASWLLDGDQQQRTLGHQQFQLLHLQKQRLHLLIFFHFLIHCFSTKKESFLHVLTKNIGKGKILMEMEQILEQCCVRDHDYELIGSTFLLTLLILHI